MWPDWVLNPGSLAFESGALLFALGHPACQAWKLVLGTYANSVYPAHMLQLGHLIRVCTDFYKNLHASQTKLKASTKTPYYQKWTHPAVKDGHAH